MRNPYQGLLDTPIHQETGVHQDTREAHLETFSWGVANLSVLALTPNRLKFPCNQQNSSRSQSITSATGTQANSFTTTKHLLENQAPPPNGPAIPIDEAKAAADRPAAAWRLQRLLGLSPGRYRGHLNGLRLKLGWGGGASSAEPLPILPCAVRDLQLPSRPRCRPVGDVQWARPGKRHFQNPGLSIGMMKEEMPSFSQSVCSTSSKQSSGEGALVNVSQEVQDKTLLDSALRPNRERDIAEELAYQNKDVGLD